jgi:hypothetical protein
MKKLISMPKIPQFRNIIREISHTSRFVGIDAEENPIYNNNPLPTLHAVGTVKLHGTNGSVCFNAWDGLWAQSKNNIITPLKDNAGFACFVEKNSIEFINMIHSSIPEEINFSKETVSIYGEWAGKGIQAGVGISQLEKKFYIFGVKISPFDDSIPAYWIDSDVFDLKKYDDIFHIKDFAIFKLDIDFNEPMLFNNVMVEMVLGVEKECPVAKNFGVSGIGEGIVFEIIYNGITYRWKMKGDKHAGISKVKKVQKVDDEKLQKIIDVVEIVTPEWRLSQMYNETFDTINGGSGDIKKTGDYLRAVIRDIMAEDIDVILDVDLTPKDVNQRISRKARDWFIEKLNVEAGL